ncbi:hypothetical protein C943_01127 [Mariniradius saccharolyticus AK6]|uniref:Uncharacterized protein n=1 Tax=Mariniradius saccharolyticus AK6 TaxID=1239962 RepID=M7X4P7_9BACT|nr:hypothetical protein C943_01127 [Mariniradius saccharolyticus AK6]
MMWFEKSLRCHNEAKGLTFGFVLEKLFIFGYQKTTQK